MANIPDRIVKHEDAMKAFDANLKCCQKCAFRSGSPEREDEWRWLEISESAEVGYTFFCHESIPNHPGEVIDGKSRFRVCAGRIALHEKPMIHLCFPAIQKRRIESTEKGIQG